MFYTYIIKSRKTGKRYIGSTQSISERLSRHNRGGNLSTKGGRPWYLIYKEIYETRAEAEKREKELKSYKGGNKLTKLLEKSARVV